MNFIKQEIEDYAISYSTRESESLGSLTRETNLKTYMPRMLSGHLQGRILSMLSKIMEPQLIVEVGTFTGYSASCLAEGLATNGKLITFEISDEVALLAKKHFEVAGLEDKIEIRIGNAIELIPTLENGIDLIFIDADKENYSAYWELLYPKLRKGGLLIADNVLWSGKVLEPEQNQDKETKELIAFTKKALADENSEQVLLPVRDGLLIIRKIK